MNLKNKIGFICRTEQDWIECQKGLFKLNFKWPDETTNILEIKQNSLPLILIINYKFTLSNKKKYSSFKALFICNYPYKFNEYNGDVILYEAKIFLRKYKLEKINGFK